jgi:hypothetical protein
VRALKLRDCTPTDFTRFVKAYPRELVWHVTMICEPAIGGYYDFTLGAKGDESTRVAEVLIPCDGFRYGFKICNEVPGPGGE